MPEEFTILLVFYGSNNRFGLSVGSSRLAITERDRESCSWRTLMASVGGVL